MAHGCSHFDSLSASPASSSGNPASPVPDLKDSQGFVPLLVGFQAGHWSLSGPFAQYRRLQSKGVCWPMTVNQSDWNCVTSDLTSLVGVTSRPCFSQEQAQSEFFVLQGHSADSVLRSAVHLRSQSPLAAGAHHSLPSSKSGALSLLQSSSVDSFVRSGSYFCELMLQTLGCAVSPGWSRVFLSNRLLRQAPRHSEAETFAPGFAA